tara:strand:+ start:504 stop:998 length:495 start_codon:yes stop_codon:yes gene_type:complete
MSTTSPYRVIRVTPTIETSEYTAGDVLFNSTEIPNAVYGKGGCSRLVGFGMTDYSDQLTNDLHMRFTTKQQNMGTRNSAVSISDADLKTAGLLGHYPVAVATFDMDNTNSKSIFFGETSTSQVAEIFLQADTNSTSVYFTAVTAGTITYTAADDLEFWFLIQQY